MLSGFAAVLGLATVAVSYLTVQVGLDVSREAGKRDRETVLSEHYSAAVAQLDSDSVVGRVGGIHSLEQIAKPFTKERDDPAQRYRKVVLEILGAFVRQEAPAAPKSKPKPKPTVTECEKPRGIRPRADVQAAMTAVGRRYDPQPQDPVDVHGRNLTGVDLGGRRFDGADFAGARLAHGSLKKVHFKGTVLNGADLSGASLQQAVLDEAKLVRAVLCGAVLDGAKLNGAGLGGAYLTDAKLGGARMRDATLVKAHLVGAQLNDAHLEKSRAVRADFTGAVLSGAHLEGANLKLATFTRAQLNQADLAGADLTGAKGLTIEQLKSVKRITGDTQLPERFTWSAKGGVRER
ncbi:pentapeptide repeat-containing protein [Streptomyces sp. SID12501]|nr:pentapeptide repeat-containing protein [Streptomyces sp. SID12501]